MATTLEQLTYELTQSAEGFNGQIHYDSKGIATLGSGVALINYNSNEEQKFSRKTTIGKISIEEFLKLVTGQQNVAHLITILDNDVISLNQGNGHISSSSDFEINISQDFFVSHIWGGEVGLYETYLNRAKSILDNENTSIYSSITDAQKAVVFSLTFAGAMGSNMARALSHYVSSNAEESFIGRMSSWYEILYQSNNNTSVSDRPGQQNRRFMEANVFLTNNLGSKPTASTAASSFFVSNYNEAKLAVAFMNCKAEEMLNFYKSGNLGGYTNRNYEIVQNHFSQAISTFLSNQNYNGSYDIDTLFKEWNLFIDLQIDVIGQNRPDGTTSHGNITGSDKKDLIFITADKDDTEVRAGTGDDFVGGSSKKDTVYSGNGNDVIYTFSGNDTVYTTDGTSSDYNQIYLGGGKDKDVIIAGDGENKIFAGDGTNHVTAGSALVYYASSVAGNLIDSLWKSGKDFLIDLYPSIEKEFNNFRNELSPELQTIFDQCAIPVLNGLKNNFPTDLNNFQSKIQEEYPDKLNNAANNLGLNVCSIPNGPKETISKLITTAEVTRSPLVIDLDGDGVETTTKYNGVYFDHDGNGFAEKTGWASPDDGILIHDINNNSSNLLAA